MFPKVHVLNTWCWAWRATRQPLGCGVGESWLILGYGDPGFLFIFTSRPPWGEQFPFLRASTRLCLLRHCSWRDGLMNHGLTAPTVLYFLRELETRIYSPQIAYQWQTKVPFHENPALKTKEYICACLQSMGELVIGIWVSLRQMTASWLCQSPLSVNLPLSIHTSISQDYLQVGTGRFPDESPMTSCLSFYKEYQHLYCHQHRHSDL